MSGVATITTMFWLSSGAIHVSVIASSSSLVSSLPAEVVDGISFWSISNPLLTLIGITFSGALISMANTLADSIINRVEVSIGPSGKATNMIATAHTFFGTRGRGVPYGEFSLDSFKESEGMLTYTTKDSGFLKYYKIIDIESGELIDKKALIEALNYCTVGEVGRPKSASVIQAQSKTEMLRRHKARRK